MKWAPCGVARMPHNQAIVPGGVTEVPDSQKMVDFKFRLAELIDFIDNKYIPTVKAVAATYPEYFNIGAGCKNMMSYGVFPLAEGALKDFVHQEKFFPSKVLLGGQLKDLQPELIGEDVKYSWYKDEIDKDPTKAVVTPDTEQERCLFLGQSPPLQRQCNGSRPLGQINNRSEQRRPGSG